MRPKKHIDKDQFTALMALAPTLEIVADFFKCSTMHIERFAKREFKSSFVDLRRQNRARLRASLEREAINRAISGQSDTMLIFCLKNLCGWSDNLTMTVDINQDLSKLEGFKLIEPIEEVIATDGNVTVLAPAKTEGISKLES